jgi:acyl carrier protein
MDMGVIESGIKKIVAEILGIEFSRVTANADFVANLGADSIHLMDIILGIEKKFEIVIPSEDRGQIRTLAQAFDYIVEAIRKQKKQP